MIHQLTSQYNLRHNANLRKWEVYCDLPTGDEEILGRYDGLEWASMCRKYANRLLPIDTNILGTFCMSGAGYVFHDLTASVRATTYSIHGWKPNILQSLLVGLTGLPISNPEVVKVRSWMTQCTYWANRLMWGTQGRQPKCRL
jgi:hypothetical protein